MSRKHVTPKRRPSKVKALKLAKQTCGFQLKITLLGTKPTVWRRFQVSDCTLEELHRIIQCVMGWDESHLHQFVVGKDFYGVPDEFDMGFGPKLLDEAEYRISDLIPLMARVFRMVYEYDFGDSWEHGVELEKRLTVDDFDGKAVCLEGGRACPPEDCGGVWGYAEILELLKKKQADDLDDDDLDRLEWVGEYDPEEFSVEEVNKGLRKYFG